MLAAETRGGGWVGVEEEDGGPASVGVDTDSSSVETSTGSTSRWGFDSGRASGTVMFWYFWSAVIIRAILAEEFDRFLKMSSIDLSGFWVLMLNTLAIFSAPL